VPTSEPARHDVTTFGDVVGPADDYRSGIPVVVQVNAEQLMGRRVIDFLSGLAYGTDGTFEKVAERVYLVTPSNAR
jgi:cell division inhibitor SepF